MGCLQRCWEADPVLCDPDVLCAGGHAAYLQRQCLHVSVVGGSRHFKTFIKIMMHICLQQFRYLNQGNKITGLFTLGRSKVSFLSFRPMVVLSLLKHHKAKHHFVNLRQSKACWGEGWFAAHGHCVAPARCAGHPGTVHRSQARWFTVRS